MRSRSSPGWPQSPGMRRVTVGRSVVSFIDSILIRRSPLASIGLTQRPGRRLAIEDFTGASGSPLSTRASLPPGAGAWQAAAFSSLLGLEQQIPVKFPHGLIFGVTVQRRPALLCMIGDPAYQMTSGAHHAGPAHRE